MKKLLVLAVLFTGIFSTNTVYANTPYYNFEYNYEVQSGPDSKEIFGVSTETDDKAENPLQQNVRRNKDVTTVPPRYGVFSGTIPTDKSNPYVELVLPSNVETVSNAKLSERLNPTEGELLPSTSFNTTSMNTATVPSVTIYNNNQDGASSYSDGLNVSPQYYGDGSIGLLSIPRMSLKVKVWEGETLDSMKKGVGHFEFTSAWDGNVGLAGHNRGSADYFKDVKNLKIGDELTYETLYGTRRYKVIVKEKIGINDFSYLNYENDNVITLITCVENVPDLRWVVQAKETK